jgi:hypothetical protein
VDFGDSLGQLGLLILGQFADVLYFVGWHDIYDLVSEISERIDSSYVLESLGLYPKMLQLSGAG